MFSARYVNRVPNTRCGKCTGLVYWSDVTLVSGATYTVNVYLDNEQQTCYSDAITLTSLATLNLQSHWGSGVIFSNMDVTAKA